MQVVRYWEQYITISVSIFTRLNDLCTSFSNGDLKIHDKQLFSLNLTANSVYSDLLSISILQIKSMCFSDTRFRVFEGHAWIGTTGMSDFDLTDISGAFPVIWWGYFWCVCVWPMHWWFVLMMSDSASGDHVWLCLNSQFSQLHQLL